MRPLAILFGAVLGLSLAACQQSSPLELDGVECAIVACGYGGMPNLPTPAVALSVSTSTPDADPDWTVELLIRDAEDEQAPPDVVTRLALNTRIGFIEGQLGFGRHYVLLRDIPGWCKVSNDNPQLVTLEADQQRSVAFLLTCE